MDSPKTVSIVSLFPVKDINGAPVVSVSVGNNTDVTKNPRCDDGAQVKIPGTTSPTNITCDLIGSRIAIIIYFTGRDNLRICEVEAYTIPGRTLKSTSALNLLYDVKEKK
jgi:hypothetical protein